MSFHSCTRIWRRNHQVLRSDSVGRVEVEVLEDRRKESQAAWGTGAD